MTLFFVYRYIEIQFDYVHTVTNPLLLSAILFSVLTLSSFISLSGETYFFLISPVIFMMGFATIFLTSGVFARSAALSSVNLSQVLYVINVIFNVQNSFLILLTKGAMVGQAFAGVFVSLLSFGLASYFGFNDDDVSLDDTV